MSLPSMNFLYLTISEIQPGQTISRRPPDLPDTMGENNTPTALKGCGVKPDSISNCDIKKIILKFLLKIKRLLPHAKQKEEERKRTHAQYTGRQATQSPGE